MLPCKCVEVDVKHRPIMADAGQVTQPRRVKNRATPPYEVVDAGPHLQASPGLVRQIT